MGQTHQRAYQAETRLKRFIFNDVGIGIGKFGIGKIKSTVLFQMLELLYFVIIFLYILIYWCKLFAQFTIRDLSNDYARHEGPIEQQSSAQH